MKKVAALIIALIICAFSLSAFAAPNLSGYTYDQLVALQHYITQEIMSRPEWKEVEVPSGIWIVGKDIPVGTYSIHPTARGAFLRVYTDKNKMIANQGIRTESQAVGKIVLLEGYQVDVSDGSLIFSPPISLGF